MKIVPDHVYPRGTRDIFVASLSNHSVSCGSVVPCVETSRLKANNREWSGSQKKFWLSWKDKIKDQNQGLTWMKTAEWIGMSLHSTSSGPFVSILRQWLQRSSCPLLFARASFQPCRTWSFRKTRKKESFSKDLGKDERLKKNQERFLVWYVP